MKTKFDYVIHIGAHLGEEAQDYSNNGVKKVFWFEANQNLMNDLIKNVEKTRPHDDFYCQALYNVDGKELEFKVTNNGQSSSLLDLGTHSSHYPQIKVTETQKIITRRFDSYIGEVADKGQFELDGARVFLNLDVQGVEFEVLQGFGDLLAANNPNFRIDAVYTEVNYEEVYKGAKTMPFLNVLLSNYGFVNAANCPTQYGWGDALYIRGNV